MLDLHDAIRAINSSVVTIRGDVAYTQDGQVVQCLTVSQLQPGWQ